MIAEAGNDRVKFDEATRFIIKIRLPPGEGSLAPGGLSEARHHLRNAPASAAASKTSGASK